MDIKNLEEGYEHICAEFPRLPGEQDTWKK